MLRDGVEVEYPRADGSIAGDRVRLVDFDEPRGNEWLAVNQFAVIEGGGLRTMVGTGFGRAAAITSIDTAPGADWSRCPVAQETILRPAL
jgi:hypothetical protein